MQVNSVQDHDRGELDPVRWTTTMRQGPQALSSFVGRHDDVRRTQRAVREGRLVTVLGPGGIGKTRLVGEVVRGVQDDFADGICFVDLTGVPEGGEVVPAVVRALGLTALPHDEPAERLRRFVADASLLLVLDNCEHVVPAARALASALLPASPALHVLVTSRERLGSTAERVLELGPLTVPDEPTTDTTTTVEELMEVDAVRLLQERAAGTSGRFRWRESDAAVVAQICRRLDGLPLGIELAASRLRSMTPRELLAALDERFDYLTRGDPTARAEHRSLRAMVDWSWQLCSPAERRLWAQLSVFAGGADLDSVRAVCRSEPDAEHEDDDEARDILDVVHDLVAKSVVVADTRRPRTRLSMLDTMRDYGRRRLEESGERDAVADRHARHFSDLAARAAARFYSPAQLSWTTRLTTEGANLTRALEHLLETGTDGGRAALELGVAMRFHWMTGSLGEGERTLTRLVDGYAPVDGLLLQAMLARTTMAVGVGDISEVALRSKRATEIAETLGDPAWLRRTALFSVLAREFTGRLDPEGFDRALGALTADDDVEFRLIALSGHTMLMLTSGDVGSSHRYVEALRRGSEAVGEGWTRSFADGLGAIEQWLVGELDVATACALRAFDTTTAFGDRLSMSTTLDALAGVAGARGDHRRAAALLGAKASLLRSIGAELMSFGPTLDAAIARVADEARAAIGTSPFDDAFAEGVRSGRSLDDLRQLATRPAAAPATGGSRRGRGPLSARELEVAGLVRHGLTNGQIAERLVVSPRTVDGHLERIYEKLDIHSRAELAVWVTRHEGG